jgi:hypothetical protein
MNSDLGVESKGQVVMSSSSHAEFRGEGRERREGSGAHQGIGGEKDGGLYWGKRRFWKRRGAHHARGPTMRTYVGQFNLIQRTVFVVDRTRSMASRVESAPSMTLPKMVYLPSKWVACRMLRRTGTCSYLGPNWP